ncbi:MAG: DUF1523 family protein [Myxococcales bacterium]|nr:DUF1523 family protein [Myxococcales bacterium]
MSRVVRFVGIGVGMVLAIVVVLMLAYFLPSTAKVHVTGTEVKRLDHRTKDGFATTRDVRFIITQRVGSEETLVFRNEDTGWGWPPYFKFSSGDLTGRAINIAKAQPEAVVLVQYYGWRLSILDAYPNMLSMRVVAADHRHIPVFNIVVVTLLLGLTVLVVLRVRRLLTSLGARFARTPADSQSLE